MFKLGALLLSFVLLFTSGRAQQADTTSTEAGRLKEVIDGGNRESGSFGIGAGIDFGGFGGKLTLYPAPNFGFFVGGGYALAGFGYNLGVNLRTGTKKRTNGVFTGMYGYNAALAIQNGPSTNMSKLYYGTSIGIGLETKSRRNKKNYTSLGLILPFRDPNLDKDMNALRSVGYQISDPWPILFKVGYHWGF